MGAVNALLEDGDIAKIVVAYTQGVAGLAGINRCGAERQSSFQHGQGTGRGQQFGGLGLHGAHYPSLRPSCKPGAVFDAQTAVSNPLKID